MEMVSKDNCQPEQILAYIDGELDASAVDCFEQHITECEVCRTELRQQRVFLCHLDAVMNDTPDVPAPVNFAKIIAAHAETDMRGVRSRLENKRALRFILVLGLAAFSLLGATASEIVVNGGRIFTTNVLGLAAFAWKTTYDTASSTAVISKVLSRRFVIESGLLGLLVVFLCLAVLLLSRLIANYHRARAIE
jgi:Putative zinc-finger